MSEIANVSLEDGELSEFRIDVVDEEEDGDESILTVSQQSRGRPRIPEKWTRVINVNTADVGRIKTYVLASDLLVAQALPTQSRVSGANGWEPIFFPKQFVKNHSKLIIKDYQLSDEELRQFGADVS